MASRTNFFGHCLAFGPVDLGSKVYNVYNEGRGLSIDYVTACFWIKGTIRNIQICLHFPLGCCDVECNTFHLRITKFNAVFMAKDVV